ncbi:DUF2341 domain-containing protein [Chloroflexota bacterium]
MCKLIRVLIILGILLIMVPFPVMADSGIPEPTIEGDRVYIDDDNVYLAATPHTIASSGWVEFTLISKKYEGDIDVAWGSNSVEGLNMSKPQLWRENVSHSVKEPYQVEVLQTIRFDTIEAFTILEPDSEPPDVGSPTNTKLIRFRVSDALYSPIDRATFTIAYQSIDQIDDTTADVTYYDWGTAYQDAIEVYDDWVPLPSNTLQQDYVAITQNINKWLHYTVDKPIQKDVTYKLRVWVDVPFAGLDTTSGEYFFAVKPSSESITQAWQAGHLYVLDPWYNSYWRYRKYITFDNSASSENLTDFPVLVTCNGTNFTFSEALADGGDIRFTDSDGTTLIEYFVDGWDTANTTATMWVKVPQINAASTTDNICMYWGNAGASTTGDTERVFGDWSSVSTCDALANWTGNTTGVGSVTPALDSVTYHDAPSSIKTAVVAAAAAVYTLAYEPAAGCDWDFSDNGSTLDFWFRSTSANISFTNSRVYLYDSDNDTIWWYMGYSATTWTNIVKPLNVYDGSSGTFDSDCVERVSIIITDDGVAANFDFWVDTVEERHGAVFAGVYNGSSAAVLNDATRYDNNGTIGGAAWLQSPDCLWRLSYDGNDYVDVPQSAAHDLTRYTLSALILDSNAVQGNRKIISKRSSSNSSATFQFGAEDAANWGNYWTASTVTKAANWALDTSDGAGHLVFLAKDNATAPLMYHNGASLGSAGNSDDPDYITEGVTLGCSRWSGARNGFWTGGMAIPLIYNYVLSDNWTDAAYKVIGNTFNTFVAAQALVALTTKAAIPTMTAAGTMAVTLSGNVTNLQGLPSCNVSFQYGALPYTTNTTETTVNATGNYTDNVYGLGVPGGTYSNRIQAVNSLGRGYGDNLTFTYTMPNITTLAADGVDMNGRITNMQTANSTAVWFDWGYTVGLGNSVLDSTATTTGDFAYDVSTIPVDPLQTVFYRIRVVNGAVSANGAIVSFSPARQVDAFTGYETMLLISPLLIIIGLLIGAGVLTFKGATEKNALVFGIGMALLAIAFFMLPLITDAIEAIRTTY